MRSVHPHYKYIQWQETKSDNVNGPTFQIGARDLGPTILGEIKVMKSVGKVFFVPAGVNLDRWQVNDIYKFLRYMTTKFFFY